MNRRKKSILLLASLAIILLVSVGATLAFLVDKSGPVTNTFEPGNVAVEVQESFAQGGTEKNNVSIKNTGNVDAYIRVAIIPTWEDDDGNPVGVAASLSDLTIDWGANGSDGTEDNPSQNWVKGADGFWYYTSSVAPQDSAPQDSTDILIYSATVKADSAGYKAGYHMNLQILAQSIQAEPADAVKEAWGEAAAKLVGAILVGAITE